MSLSQQRVTNLFGLKQFSVAFRGKRYEKTEQERNERYLGDGVRGFGDEGVELHDVCVDEGHLHTVSGQKEDSGRSLLRHATKTKRDAF